ncbi:MAG: hypothetical protein SGI92_24435 [Bryobacteraceae bacterium]|nr:hypothetical protein [Bryobacteraceae bacterium]
MRLNTSADVSAAVAVRSPLSQSEFPADGSARSKLEFLIRYAILAPSGHNTQPWKFRINGSTLDVVGDLSRAMPITDPDNRELVMSCGAALLNLRVAARNFGLVVQAELCPEPDEPELLARLCLTGVAPSGRTDFRLFKAIRERRTTRLPFEPRQIPRALLFRWQKAAMYEEAWMAIVDVPDTRRAIARMIAEGDGILASRAGYRSEIAGWMRSNDTACRDGLPGYSVGFGSLSSRLSPPTMNSFGSAQGRRDEELVLRAPGFCVLGTETDTARDWMLAGQALGRVLLSAQSEGVTASFFLQPVEVPELRNKLMELLPEERGYPQIAFRLGYAPRVAPTPRRPLGEVVSVESNHTHEETDAEDLPVVG